VEELLEVLMMLKMPEFKPYAIYDNLHQQITNAVHNKYINQFDMLESSWDRDQDLTMFMLEVLRETNSRGNSSTDLKMELDENGELLFWREASAGFPFQIGQIRYILCIYHFYEVQSLNIL
jgi:hypothetical protein